MRWTIEHSTIVVYEDELRIDIEAMRLFLDQPVGTILLRPDGSTVEFLGRQGTSLVFRNLPPGTRGGGE